MLNSSSSITPFVNAPDMTLSNTTKAGVTMSINLVTFLSFFCYFLVSVEIIPLTIAPVIDAAPKAALTGIPMNVANVATLDIPVATLIPLEQTFSLVSLFNILLYFWYFCLNICSLFFNPLCLAWITLRWYATWDPRGPLLCGGGASGRVDGIGGYIL